MNERAEDIQKGVARYTTKDGVRTMRLHYSADPDKDPDTTKGHEWLARQLRGYAGGMNGVRWRREMEIDWSIHGTERVWPEFVSKMEPRITCEPFDVPEHWPIWCGYDYGSVNPFAWVAIAWESEDLCYLIDEIYHRKTPLHEQARLIRSRPYFERIQGTIGDRSIWNITQQSREGEHEATSIGAILHNEYDLYIEKSSATPGNDIAFRDLLNGVLWRNLEAPQFIIFNDCKNTLREFRNLRMRDWVSQAARDRQNRPEEILGKENHAWDAIKYVMLSRHHESPELLGPPEGTFEWYRQRLIQLRRHRETVLS